MARLLELVTSNELTMLYFVVYLVSDAPLEKDPATTQQRAYVTVLAKQDGM